MVPCYLLRVRLNMLVAYLSAQTGLPAENLALLLGMLFAYPIAWMWRKLPKDATTQHAFSLILGAWLLWFAYGTDAVLHAVVCTALLLLVVCREERTEIAFRSAKQEGESYPSEGREIPRNYTYILLYIQLYIYTDTTYSVATMTFRAVTMNSDDEIFLQRKISAKPRTLQAATINRYCCWCQVIALESRIAAPGCGPLGLLLSPRFAVSPRRALCGLKTDNLNPPPDRSARECPLFRDGGFSPEQVK